MKAKCTMLHQTLSMSINCLAYFNKKRPSISMLAQAG